MFNQIRSQSSRIALVSLVSALAACSGGSGEPASQNAASAETYITDDTPFVFVERNTEQSAEQAAEKLSAKLFDENSSPLDVYSPYEYNPGAKLVRRSSLDVNGVNRDVLRDYFESDAYDVKDLNVSYDGSKVLFAAHGPSGHSTDNSWNIYEYEFATGRVRRVIAEDNLANSGEDTNPAYADDGMIVFSSDRAAGNPNNPTLNQIPADQPDCYKVGANERPSLLHSMNSAGENIVQITYGNQHDTKPASLSDGRVAFLRWKRSYEFVRECNGGDAGANSLSKMSATELFKSEYPAGMEKPDSWGAPEQCAYAQQTPFGPVLATNHYTLLRINADGSELEQLYQTVTTKNSEESLLHLDEIIQSESGRLVALLKHRYNSFLGGNVMELMDPAQGDADKVFANMAMQPVISEDVSLFPNQVSMAGWFSAVAPYRDGSQRLLVSWSQCKTVEGGVSDFCTGSDKAQNVDNSYGIWVYDPNGDSRLPIVRAKSGVEYTEIALSQPHKGVEFPFNAIDPNVAPDVDDSRIICDDPSYVEPTSPPSAEPTIEPVTPTPTGGPSVPTGTPTGEPGTPTGEPGTPTGEPGTPTGEPGTPTGEPGTPTGEPGTPTGEPGTPTGEPGTPT
ncbi:WD40-like Beta Propeller Repeat, partial [Alteromonadaceae bacterium Bs31]